MFLRKQYYVILLSVYPDEKIIRVHNYVLYDESNKVVIAELKIFLGSSNQCYEKNEVRNRIKVTERYLAFN